MTDIIKEIISKLPTVNKFERYYSPTVEAGLADCVDNRHIHVLAMFQFYQIIVAAVDAELDSSNNSGFHYGMELLHYIAEVADHDRTILDLIEYLNDLAEAYEQEDNEASVRIRSILELCDQ